MPNRDEKILVVGACGQIGVELTLQLRKMYGEGAVIASDLREEHPLLKGTGPYVSLDIMNKETFHVLVLRYNITQVYLLAAILSATGEKNPLLAWHMNMQSLLNVLDVAKEEKLAKFTGQAVLLFLVLTHQKIIHRNIPLLNQPLFMALVSLPVNAGATIIVNRYNVDVRSLRYPGLISYKSQPGGGTTDYAIEIFHDAIKEKQYTSFFKRRYLLAYDVYARCHKGNH